MPELTIKNATIVNEGSLSEKDLFVKDGRIEKIEDSRTNLWHHIPNWDFTQLY